VVRTFGRVNGKPTRCAARPKPVGRFVGKWVLVNFRTRPRGLSFDVSPVPPLRDQQLLILRRHENAAGPVRQPTVGCPPERGSAHKGCPYKAFCAFSCPLPSRQLMASALGASSRGRRYTQLVDGTRILTNRPEWPLSSNRTTPGTLA